jgi:hypothetical protein
MVTRLFGISNGHRMFRDTSRLRRSIRTLTPAAMVGCIVVSVAAVSSAESVDFSRDIQPLLAKRCFSCHGPDTHEGGLRLDQQAGATAALDSGSRAIVAGKSAESEIIARITSSAPDLQMPPDGKLPAAAVQTIEEWVRRGLPWPDDGKPKGTAKTGVEAFDIAKRKAEHWCWQPPRVSGPPAVQNAACLAMQELVQHPDVLVACAQLGGLEAVLAAAPKSQVNRVMPKAANGT